uniref:NudC domain-containing protein 1 n=1 Tax=Anopheles farauti TaxID=69004 RepID=A0A182Q738_9DIPT
MNDQPRNRTNIELRPDSKYLNRNHNGYKLSLDPVPTYRTDLAPSTQPDRVSPSDHRYSHLRLYGMQNHLVADPWTAGQSYYIDRSGMVQCVQCDPSCGKLRPLVAVYKLRLADRDADQRYNRSLAFPSDRLCLVCDGTGTLHVLDTGERGGGREWKPQTVVKDAALDGVLMDARWVVHSSERLLHVVTLQLARGEAVKANGNGAQTLHWSTLVQAEPGGQWTLSVTRTLGSKGYPYYCALDYQATGVLVASDHPFRFVHDSLHPVAPVDPEPAPDPEPTETTYAWERYPFTWSQSEDELSVTFAKQADVQYRVRQTANSSIQVYANDVLVVDSAKLFATIDITTACWTQDANKLELTLPKSVPGAIWPVLLPGGPDESGTDGPTEQHADPAPNLDVPLEDCDLGPDDTYYTLERIASDHTVTHSVWLGRVAPLFAVRLRADQPSAIVLRYDVDACVWQLQPSPATDGCHLRHEGTLHTFGYVQAAKQQQKYLDCAPDLSYGVICESQRSVFLYRSSYGASGAGLRHRSGTPVAVGQLQYVTLENAGEIVGVSCANRSMLLLTERAVVAVQVSPDEE